MDYSIIIVTYRRYAALCETLRALAPLMDEALGELIVVDQCPEAALPDDVLKTPKLRYIALQQPGMVLARNVGLTDARGEIVLFLDDDVVPSPALIAAHLEAFHDPTVGAVAGRILDPGQTASPAPHAFAFDLKDGWRFAQFDHASPGDVMTARGCNMSFRRRLLVELGGFDPHIAIFRDDTDMCLRVIRAGYRVRFVPRAELVHLNAPTGGTRGQAPLATNSWSREWQMYRQHYRHYRDNLYFLCKHFRGREKWQWIADSYRTYVGLSRWPWRLAAKNACYILALAQAEWMANYRKHHPCSL